MLLFLMFVLYTRPCTMSSIFLQIFRKNIQYIYNILYQYRNFMHIYTFLTIYCIYAYPPPQNMHFIFICCNQILIICELYLIICNLHSFICDIRIGYCKGQVQWFFQGAWGAELPQITISGWRQRSAAESRRSYSSRWQPWRHVVTDSVPRTSLRGALHRNQRHFWYFWCQKYV